MNSHRTGGMTAIGILNMVFGSLGALGCIFMVLLGGLLTAGGSSLSGSGDTAELGSAMATGGMLAMLFGLVYLAFWGMMAASGFGILKMLPWGRSLGMICAVAGIALTLLTVVTSGFAIGLMNVFTLCYCGTLMYFFMQPEWKSAFCCEKSHEPASMPSQDQSNYRAAA